MENTMHNALRHAEIVDLILRHVRSPADIACAMGVCAMWRTTMKRIQRIRTTGASWPTNAWTDVHTDLREVRTWLADCGVVPEICILFSMNDAAMAGSDPTQRCWASTIKNMDVLPKSTKVWGCTSDAILSTEGAVGEHVQTDDGVQNAIAIMVVPRQLPLTAKVLNISLSLSQQHSGAAGVSYIQSKLQPHLQNDTTVPVFMGAIATTLGLGPLAVRKFLQLANTQLSQTLSTVSVCGGFTAQRLAGYANAATESVQLSVLLLCATVPPSDSGTDRDTHRVFSECVGVTHMELRDKLSRRAVRKSFQKCCGGAISFSCIGRLDQNEHVAVREAAPNLPLIGFFGHGELGRQSGFQDHDPVNCSPDVVRQQDIGQWAYMNYVQAVGTARP
eukprot:m.432620 g.432620  ORF g.432620 m.432620 type:complete len:390 (+) comp21412_c1_seq2:254-1423(+)